MLHKAILSILRYHITKYLWIRMEILKFDHRHFDALNHSRLICALDPKLTTAWVYQSWMMAYVISSEVPNLAECWHWVMAGISLLRDEALKHNPRNPQLYSYLSYFFLHKMGDNTDDYHIYYKRRLVLEMVKILGPRQETMNAELQWLARAPRQWSEVIGDPNVAELVSKIKEAEPVKFPNDTALQETFLDYISYPESFYYPKAFIQLMSNHSRHYTLRKLTGYLRRCELWNRWKMEPSIMLKLNEKYGPYDYAHESRRLSLDWRQPYAHAIYWAWQGKPYTTMKDDFYFLRIRQNIYHSLQKLFEMGHIMIYAYGKPEEVTAREPGQEIIDRIARERLVIFNSQDLRMFDPAYEATEEVIQSYKDLGEVVPEPVYTAFSYLVWNGIESFYLAGYKEVALKYFKDLRKRFPENQDYFKKGTVEDSLIAFVKRNIQEELNEIGPKKAANYIDSLLRQSFDARAQDNPDIATVMEARAKWIHDYFMEERKKDEREGKGSSIFPSFSLIRFESLANFLDDPQVNPAVKQLLLTKLKQEHPKQYEQVLEELKKRRSRK